MKKGTSLLLLFSINSVTTKDTFWCNERRDEAKERRKTYQEDNYSEQMEIIFRKLLNSFMLCCVPVVCVLLGIDHK